jgi:hypothetical protein
MRTYFLLVDSVGRREFGRRRRRREDNIAGVRLAGWDGVDWLNVAEGGKKWGAVMEPRGSVKCEECLVSGRYGTPAVSLSGTFLRPVIPCPCRFVFQVVCFLLRLCSLICKSS